MSRSKSGVAPIVWLLVLVLAGATGCGLGGDSGDEGSGSAKTVPGRATAGPFQSGKIAAYKLLTTGATRGQKGSPLASGVTNASGNFTLTISDSSWTGPVLLEVSGSFLDESKPITQDSGLSTIPETMPVRAILPSLSAAASPRIYLTPVTELATRYALRQLSADATTPATELIGQAYRAAAAAVLPGVAGDQLLYTDPLDAAVAPTGTTTHTNAQIEYGVVLAGWAQLAGSNNVQFAELLDSLGTDFAFDGLINASAGGQDLNLVSTTGSGVVTYTQTFITTTLSGAVTTFLGSSRNVAGPSATDPRILALTQDLLANVAPTAAIIPLTFDFTVGSQVRVSGAASTTLRTNVTLVYTWSVTREGAPVSVTGATSAVVSFVPQAAGLHAIVLTVSDGRQVGTASISLNIAEGGSQGLSVQSFVVAPGTVTAGNTFTATLVVSNPGSATVTSVTPALSFTRGGSDAAADFSGGSFQPPHADIPAGSSQTFVATVTALQTAAAGDLTVGAAVTGGGRTVNASPASLHLDAQASTTTLSVGSFTLSTSSGLPGTGFDAVLVVNNAGSIAAAGVVPAIVFSNAQGITVGTTFPASGSIPVAGAITFTFPVDVALSVSPGTITVTAAAAGSNAAAVQSPARTFTVLPMPTASLVAEALSLSPTAAGAGSLLHAFVTVRNSSSTATALGVVPQLVFRRGGVAAGGDFNLGTPAPASASIAPSARVTFDLPVTILAAAAQGTVTVTGTVQGSNAAAVNLPQANLTIPSKASLSLTRLSVSRSRVSTGQSFTVTATLQNNGQLQGRVTQLTLGLGAGLTGGTYSGTTNLGAGSVGTIPVTVTATSAGTYSLTTVTFSAIDTTSGLALPVAANSATPTAVIVQNRPGFAFGSVAPATALTGTTARVILPVTNNGPGNVDFVSPALTFSGANVTAVLFGAAPLNVATGSTVQLPFDVAVGATALVGARQGSLAFDVQTADTGFRYSAQQPLLASLTVVQNPAVGSISPASMTTETARSFTALVTVSNPNSLASTSVTVSLTGSGFNATASQANPVSIPASGSAQFSFTVTAGSSASITSATFRVTGKLAGVGFAVQRVYSNYLTVTAPATTVALSPLELYSSTLSLGQTVRVTVPVVNTLTTTATVVSFTVSDADFPTVGMTFSPVGGNPTSIAPNGGTTRFVFETTVPVEPGADLGSHLLRAGLRWRRSTDSVTVPATLVTRDATVTVQNPVTLTKSAGALDGRTGTADGAFLEKGTTRQLLVTIANGDSCATASLTTVQATVTGASPVTIVPPAGIADLAAGVSRSVQFSLTATSGTNTGNAAFDLTATFRDLNRPASDSSGRTTVTTRVNFQVVGAPRLSAKGTFPTTITAGERNIPMTVVYSNQTYSAPASVTGITFTFFKFQSATPNLTANYQVKSSSPALPFTVPLTGTHSITVSYLVDLLSKSSTVTTRTDMYVQVTGSDPATGVATGIDDGKLLDFWVEAARPRLVIDKMTPVKSVLSAGMATRIDMQVRNTGGEDARLQLPPGPVPAFASGVTPVTAIDWSLVLPATGTIAANTTVTYSFDVTPTTTVSAFGAISLGANLPATSVAAPYSDVSTSGTRLGTLIVARPANAASEFDVEVQGPGAIDKTGLPSGQSTTSSTAVVVTISAKNSDLATADLSNFQLLLTSGTTNLTGQYAVTLPSGTVRLGTGATKLVTFQVTALQTAMKFRSIKVTAVMTASDVNSSQSTSVTTSDYWVVRDRAVRVLGQGDLGSGGAGTSVSALDSPEAFLVDGNRLLVADTGNNRVLIYNQASDLTPTVVLGQPDFDGGSPNQGLNGAALDRMSGPRGLSVTGTKLLVADSGNHRVLMFDNYPTAVNGDFADRQLGQFDAADRNPNRGAGTGNTVSNGFSSPAAVAVTGDYLVVSDTGNSRVVVYSNLSSINSAILARNAVATGVFGQAGITGTANGYANQSAQGNTPPTTRTLSAPTGLCFWNDKLVVADTMNHRVLVYSSFSTRCSTTTTDQAADLVVGQPSFLTATSPLTPTASSLTLPRGVSVAGDKLYVSDSGNNRVLVFSGFGSLPTTGAVAVDLFGQELFDQSQTNRRSTERTDNVTATSETGGAPDGYGLYEPVGIFAPAPQGKTGFWTVDELNNRVLLVPLP